MAGTAPVRRLSRRCGCSLKIFALILLFIWVRATLPRLRYDQLMSFGWKMLLPLATLNVLVTAIVLVAHGQVECPTEGPTTPSPKT